MPLEIPEVVIDRLPVYFRLLSRIADEGRTVISSQELGDELDVTPAQIRKDLSYFGRFGKQGRGYSVQRLTEEVDRIDQVASEADERAYAAEAREEAAREQADLVESELFQTRGMRPTKE